MGVQHQGPGDRDRLLRPERKFLMRRAVGGRRRRARGVVRRGRIGTANVKPSEVIAGVLIGGQSRRMGTCKALSQFHGTTFVDRVVGVAQAVVDEVVLLGNAELSTPGLTGVPRLADEPNFAGPLAGLVSLLEYAGSRWSLLIACDMPLIEAKILQRLLDACAATVDAAAFRIAGEHDSSFPCCVVFHPRVAFEARSELARSASLRALIGRLRCGVLEADASEAHCLRSFNTPEEYADLITEELARPLGCSR